MKIRKKIILEPELEIIAGELGPFDRAFLAQKFTFLLSNMRNCRDAVIEHCFWCNFIVRHLIPKAFASQAAVGGTFSAVFDQGWKPNREDVEQPAVMPACCQADRCATAL